MQMHDFDSGLMYEEPFLYVNMEGKRFCNEDTGFVYMGNIRVRKDYEISITLNASFDQVEQLKAVSTYDGAEIFEEISEKGA